MAESLITPLNKRLLCMIGLCILLEMLSACSSLGVRARRAVAAAARDPWIWAPLAGAVAVTATNNDERISRWAKEKTPVFGSQEAAEAASDRYRLYASSATWTIFLSAPQQSEGGWLAGKGKDMSSSLAGLAMARNTTGVLKSTAQRERPNGSPLHDSFPSAHSTDAFAHAALARRYAEEMPIYQPLRTGMQWATNGFAFATAWGRVEGGFHYPSDVLVGAAVANFATQFFMNDEVAATKSPWRVRPRTDGNGKLFFEVMRPL